MTEGIWQRDLLEKLTRDDAMDEMAKRYRRKGSDGRNLAEEPGRHLAKIRTGG